jgi:transposase
MKLYVGDDLHSSNNYLAINDETGKRVFHRKLPNNAETIIETLALYEGSIAGIVVESTYNRYWLVDALMTEGYKLHLANPSAIKYLPLRSNQANHLKQLRYRHKQRCI